MRAKFVTFEGVDGAGKSTQLAWLAGTLQARGIPVCCTREPGGTPLGEQLRTLLLDDAQRVDALTEALLMFAARQEHLQQVIRPMLAAQNWVLCDRFSDATFAYQGSGRGVEQSKLEALERIVHADLQPDLTLYFDLDVGAARMRIQGERALDRFEREDEAFYRRVTAGYRDRARRFPGRVRILDASASEPDLRKEVEHAIPAAWFV